MEQTKPIIKFEHFSFTYEGRNTPSLSDLNLNVCGGEVVLLTGKSGCGKTTFTRCLNGLIPDFFEGKLSGKCTVYDMAVGEHEAGDYSPYIGSVFQDPRSQFFTVHVNTEIPFQGENLQQDRAIIQEKYRKATELFNITKLLGKRIFHLSSGEKQKIAVSFAYTAGVHIFVLDEPSANLDETGTRQLADVLRRLKEAGNTIIISEHKIYYLKNLIDRVILMQDGKIERDVGIDQFLVLPLSWMQEHSLRQIDLHQVNLSVPAQSTARHDFEIRADSLSFCYDKSHPLWENVSFTAAGGDVVGVIGKNGAGKSTLIRVLMGLEKHHRGNILFNNERASPRQRRRSSFYVMQDVDYQLFAATVLEEMMLGTSGSEQDKEQSLNVLQKFGLADYADTHPSQLSGGQKQRLSIALAYMSSAKIIFMDEPTSGLDAENMRLVSDAITELAVKGCCLFVITHDYEFAARTFQSLLVMKESKEVVRIPPEIYTKEILFQNLFQSKGDTK